MSVTLNLGTGFPLKHPKQQPGVEIVQILYRLPGFGLVLTVGSFSKWQGWSRHMPVKHTGAEKPEHWKVSPSGHGKQWTQKYPLVHPDKESLRSTLIVGWAPTTVALDLKHLTAIYHDVFISHLPKDMPDAKYHDVPDGYWPGEMIYSWMEEFWLHWVKKMAEWKEAEACLACNDTPEELL